MQRLQRQFNSDHQHWNLQRSLTQLVSTSNKRSSSGEMKKDQKRVIFIGGKNFDTCLDQRVWTVKSIFTPFQVVQWSLISVTRCGELLQLSSDTCECVWHMGDEGMTLLNSCLVLKSLACVFVVVPSIDYSIEQVLSPAGPSWRSRYMESHIRSKIPNIIKLGQIEAWYLRWWSNFIYRERSR